MNNLFAELDSYGRSGSEDVLDAYLTGPVDAETDPIKFWVSRLDKPGSKVTPRGALARMGLDYLTAPGMWNELFSILSDAKLSM